MNRRKWLLLGFAAVAAAQLAVPAWLIVAREWTLREGRAFKFRTRPVDPADAFRGRYVWLGLEPSAVKVADVNQWHYDQPAYAVLEADSNGFAAVRRLDRAPPAHEPAVRVHVGWSDYKRGEVHLNWPGLDRYYLTEAKAPAAEAAYRAHSQRTNQACHVVVRVWGACAVIEDLYIANQPLRTWLRAHPAGK